MHTRIIFIFVSVVVTETLCDCDVSGIQGCIRNFLLLITVDYGFDLTSGSISRTCKSIEDTTVCLEEYESNCTKSSKDRELIQSIAIAKDFMRNLCSPESELYINVKNRKCLDQADDDFINCTSTPLVTQSNKFTGDCCYYQNVKDCTLKVTGEHCENSLIGYIQEVLVNTNGLGYEVSCEKEFSKCSFAHRFDSTLYMSVSVVIIFYSVLY